jgi:MFS-type transporter involved in bile tolerance (Atg22 family)
MAILILLLGVGGEYPGRQRFLYGLLFLVVTALAIGTWLVESGRALS